MKAEMKGWGTEIEKPQTRATYEFGVSGILDGILNNFCQGNILKQICNNFSHFFSRTLTSNKDSDGVGGSLGETAEEVIMH